MIKMTDNLYESRKFVLSDIVKMGYKYIVRDKNGMLYAYSCKPKKREREWVFNIVSVDATYEDISLVSALFTDIKWEDEEPFRIPCVNWDNVPVDAKVIATGVDDSEWKCHFYKKINDNSILVFRDGKTSWTTNDVVEVDINNVRLE